SSSFERPTNGEPLDDVHSITRGPRSVVAARSFVVEASREPVTGPRVPLCIGHSSTRTAWLD
ncbi:MAG: hypothetical protein WB567_02210, partial [Terracidiphilus sp.]